MEHTKTWPGESWFINTKVCHHTDKLPHIFDSLVSQFVRVVTYFCVNESFTMFFVFVWRYIFIRRKVESSIQLCFASFNGLFPSFNSKNIFTNALINIVILDNTMLDVKTCFIIMYISHWRSESFADDYQYFIYKYTCIYKTNKLNK